VDIDLLLSENGEAGLVSDGGFECPVAGVMFDALTHMFTIEFADADIDPLDLNIPAASEFHHTLLDALAIQIGVIEKGRIEESWQVPLLLINDPYGGSGGHETPIKPGNSALAFERFLQSCGTGQPIHRDDLGDESRAGAVMGGMNTAVLQFAPHLARQRALEAQPKNQMAPSTPGMGMGGGGGGGAARPSTPRRRDDEQNQ